MELKLNQLNTLPVPTFRWAGVNQTEIDWNIPTILPFRKEALHENLPNGVTASDSIEPDFPVKTGMGKAAEEFVKQYKNTGTTLVISKNAKITTPIAFTYQLDEKNSSVVDYNTIIAEENSEVTIVLTYRSNASVFGFHASETKLIAKKNATIHLIQVNLLNDQSYHFDDIGILAKDNATISVVQAELGAKRQLAGCYASLVGSNSKFYLDTIYFGDKERTIDINYIAEHLGFASESKINVNGALLNNSQKVLRSTIDFKKGAKQAKGAEQENTLMFSPKARNRTVPLILCEEDDVVGQHAATTGKIDENKLFYLMSRGLDELSAKKMIIESTFQAATEQIPDLELRKETLSYVKERLHANESF